MQLVVTNDMERPKFNSRVAAGTIAVGTADSGPIHHAGRLGHGRKFRTVIGADWGPVGFIRNFGGVTPTFCGALGRGKMSLGIRRRLMSALRYP